MRGTKGATVLFAALIAALVPFLVLGATVRISWSPNTESDLEGYRVFYGTASRSYTKTVTVGRVSSIYVEGLSSGVTYYFAVKAFDYAGNESPFSDEVFVTIPGQGSSVIPPADGASPPQGSADQGSGSNGSGSGSQQNGGLLDRIASLINTVKQGILRLLGLDTERDIYAVGDFPQAPSPHQSISGEGSPFASASTSHMYSLCKVYHLFPVHDVIMAAGSTYDLSQEYPEGSYLFYPLSESCPAIEDGLILAEEPGSFLYLCLDDLGTISHVLHVSVAQEIYGTLTCDPARSFYLEDPSTGITVSMPQASAASATPIAVGWSGEEASPAPSLVAAPGGRTFTLAVLPYGMELEKEALVTAPFAGKAARVQRYDEDEAAWVDVEGADVAGGIVYFSTQTLGRFRVSEISDQADQEPYEPGGDSRCFIEAATR